MKKNELAAAMCLAAKVCSVDDFDDKEISLIAVELKAFRLSEETEKEVLELYNEMSLFRACEILKDADSDVKKEAASLCIVAMNADGDCSEREIGACIMAHKICNLPFMSFTEAKEYLKL